MLICYDKSCTTCDPNRLLDCIEKRANDKAKSILQELSNPCNFFKHAGSTLLYYSAAYDNTTMVQHLLQVGCNINSQDKYGFTPLMLAIKENNLASIQLLLKNNADIYFENSKSLQLAVYCRLQSPFIVCINQIPHLILEMLFVKVNKDFLMNKQRIVELLLKADHLVKFAVVIFGVVELANLILINDKTNYREPIRINNAFYWTVMFGKIRNAQMLIERESKVKGIHGIAKLRFGYYTRNCEAVDKQSKLLKTLLKFRNNLNIIDEFKKDNLVYLLKSGNKDTVKTVLQCGMNEGMSCHFRDGKSLLHLLLENGNDNVLDVLDELAIDFDVNARQRNGLTPLMTAAFIGSTRKVEFLLKHGADVNLTSRIGLTALYYAASNDTPRTIHKINAAKMIELLLRYGTNCQNIYKNRRSILHVCSRYEHEFSIEVILAHLAFLKVLDHSLLTELFRREIESDLKLRTHFDLCTQQLVEMKNCKVYKTVTLFGLLIEKEKKMVDYVRNHQFKMAFDSAIVTMSHLDSYYLNTLQIRIEKALDKIEMDKKAASVIESLTGLCRDVHHFVVYKIISFLNTEDLNNLCKVDYPRDKIINVYQKNRCTSCQSVKLYESCKNSIFSCQFL